METLEVLAVEAELNLLLRNLIGNAIKFRTDRPVEVHVSAECQGGGWRFRVRDNGIGIAKDDIASLFRMGPIGRLHTRSEYPGHGIGLATCKKIVERHGGRIWIESEPGQGSTFYFTLAEEVESTSNP
jgi:signal transduction histidine kinase